MKDQPYYRFAFLRDGFPGRREADGSITAHPIYGVYVLKDYIEQYRRQPRRRIRDAIVQTARAAINRMRPFRGALVFWYEPVKGDDLSRLYRRHYSALTQTYYASLLLQASGVADAPDLKEAADRVFRSVLIPRSQGGVLADGPYGVNLAEVPQEPDSWILNGWQTALVSMGEYVRRAHTPASVQGSRLIARSLDTLERLLPLYDVPTLRNSRYGLSGFEAARIYVDVPAQAPTLASASVNVPLEGRFGLGAGPDGRWKPWIDTGTAPRVAGGFALGPRPARVNLVLSRVSYPRPNSLRLVLGPGYTGRVGLQLQRGAFDPVGVSPRPNGWGRVRWARPDARGTVDFPLPWRELELVAYPTTATKVLDGQQTNVYHAIHIKQLRALGREFHRPALTRWADRWASYVCGWRWMPQYQGLSVKRYVGSDAKTVRPSAYCR